MSRQRQGFVGARGQAGLSLVELLAAIALGASITVGIIQMVTATQGTYRVNIGQARMQESARFAMEFLTSPIRMAGFAGCYSDEGDIFSALAPNATPPYEGDFAAGAIAGHDATSATGTGTWSPGLGALPADIPVAPDPDAVTPGTDVLTIRTSDSNGARLAQAQNFDDADELVIRTPEDPGEYGVESMVVVSDCQKAAVFITTQVNTAANTMTLFHAAAPTTNTDGNWTTALSQDGSFYETDATVHAVETQIFYIAPGNGQNNRGDRPLSLWRKFGTQPPVELVEGIEDLQVLYGVDTDGDPQGVPNQYMPFQNIGMGNLADVVTMRISITANSVDVVSELGDGPLRRIFTSTVALRNRI